MRIQAAWLCSLLLAACVEPDGGGDGDPAPDPVPRLALAPFLSSLDDPVGLAHAGDGSGRLFVVEQRGIVKVWSSGRLQPEPFLDIAAGGPDAEVLAGGERGLLGLAFHPAYEDNGRFFVYYTAPGGDVIIAEYRNPQPNDDEADPDTGRVILTQEHSQYANHNGGAIAFGPDGMLYAALGDGGSSGDPDNHAQDLDTLLGKVIRIDVDNVVGSIPYTIPEGNPFANRAGRDEVWAYGLRNPWRFSFDRATGDLWIGDVGQNAWEEVDRLPAGESGTNFGWSRYEGTHTYRADREAVGAVDPVAEYGHVEGGGNHCSVVGGHVYNGQAIPGLVGTYLFADYCSGFLWALTGEGGDRDMALVTDTGLNVSAFGEDEAGELYVVDHGGDVRKVVAA